jgi:hypothetical protein
MFNKNLDTLKTIKWLLRWPVCFLFCGLLALLISGKLLLLAIPLIVFSNLAGYIEGIMLIRLGDER